MWQREAHHPEHDRVGRWRVARLEEPIEVVLGTSTQELSFTKTSSGDILYVAVTTDATTETYTEITPSGTETWTEITPSGTETYTEIVR